MASFVPRPTFGSSASHIKNVYLAGDETMSWRGDNLKWFHSHVLVTVGCAADFTALSGGLSSKVLGKTTSELPRYIAVT